MARPYSFDLRKRVVASVAGGKSCRAVAELFDVSVERGVVVSCDTLWRFLKREGISFKKNRLRN